MIVARARLPVHESREEILRTVAANQVVLVSGTILALMFISLIETFQYR